MDMLSVKKFLAVVSVFLFALSAQAETPFEGVTKGSFAVSPSGAATYTIPIEVPPGISGLQPELALTYNSQGGNGLLGMGWSLSGLSVISRCPKTYALDGEKVGVKLDATDRYCLNGQRLMVVNGMAYGTNGAEYRTEIDSFAKITSLGTGENNDGPDHFIVQTKAGRIIEFGNTPDSNVNVTIQSSGLERTLLWAVNKVSDTVGNELTISYIEEADIGHFRVSRMDYGNGNLSVRFEYPRDSDPTAVRDDLISGYIAGALYTTPTLLTNVSTYIDENVVRDYRLEYETASEVTGRLRLVSMVECSYVELPNTCKTPIMFEWQEGENTFSNPIQQYPTPWNFGFSSAWETITGDFNGDGKTDYARLGATYAHLFISNGDGTFSNPIQQYPSGWNFGNPSSWKTITGDFNGDGKTD